MAPAVSPCATAGRQHGALLVDALVAILVFSVGVLGNLALHAQAMRHVGEAHYRAEAANLAQGLIGRMWASAPGTLAADYGAPEAGPGYAAFARLARRLPGAGVAGNAPEVRVDAGPSVGSRRVTVVLHWQSPGEPRSHRHEQTAIIGGN